MQNVSESSQTAERKVFMFTQAKKNLQLNHLAANIETLISTPFNPGRVIIVVSPTEGEKCKGGQMFRVTQSKSHLSFFQEVDERQLVRAGRTLCFMTRSRENQGMELWNKSILR